MLIHTKYLLSLKWAILEDDSKLIDSQVVYTYNTKSLSLRIHSIESHVKRELIKASIQQHNQYR